MQIFLVALGILTLQTTPASVEQIQEWYEAGQYQEVVDQSEQAPDPKAEYLLAASYEKLGRAADARGVYARLVARGESDPWALVGRSASALVTDGQAPTPEAVETAFLAAQQAVAAAPQGPESAVLHYQMGLVQARRNDFAGAAVSFEQAASLDPSFAYAYYYAGLASSRIERPDRMAINFESFLELAPEAPEVPRVQSLMRSVRGR